MSVGCTAITEVGAFELNASIILCQKMLLILQSKVFNSKGRFHALGCWNHQHKRVHTKPRALEAGTVASKLTGST